MTMHDVSDLSALKAVAADFVKRLKGGDVVYLLGDLGAGKTTFCQFLLQQAGVKERVKSPTYTLYETYAVDGRTYVHMDLYRLADPEELYFLGIEELPDDAVLLVEWPDKGRGVLPEANWVLEFSNQVTDRKLNVLLKKPSI